MNKKRSCKGFTLIELLIVIAIVAILASIGMAIFATIQKNNRDQIRMRDLQTIKQALELYRSNNGGYPTDSNSDKIPDGLVPNYIINWLADPLAGQVYVYQTTASGYVICAKKEGNITNFPLCVAIGYNIGLQSD